MKTVTAFAVVGLMLAIAMPAWAVPFTLREAYTGPITMNLRNFDEGTIYVVPDGEYGRYEDGDADPTGDGSTVAAGITTMDGLPQLAPTGGFLGHQSDTWGILELQNILKADGSDDILWQRGDNGEHIMGLFWGLQDMGMEQTTNPVDGTVRQEIRGVNINLAFFFEQEDDWPGNATGPAGWSTPGGVPTYADVTDGTFMWSFVSAPGISLDDTSAEFIGEFSQNQGANFASTGAALGVVGAVPGWGEGPFNDFFIEGMVPAWAPGDTLLSGQTGVADIRFDFDATEDFSGDWLLRSTDPIEAWMPEPITMAGMLMGLASVGGYIRRRRAGK